MARVEIRCRQGPKPHAPGVWLEHQVGGSKVHIVHARQHRVPDRHGAAVGCFVSHDVAAVLVRLWKHKELAQSKGVSFVHHGPLDQVSDRLDKELVLCSWHQRNAV